VELARISLEHLEDLRVRLQAKQGLGLKTTRNVIDGSLRAMFRDARKAGLAAAFPFGDLDWPRRVVHGPDPFIEEERDRLLQYFSRKRWPSAVIKGVTRQGRTSPSMPFSSRFFYTGMRPSEAVALRVRSLDLGNGTLLVERWRSLGCRGSTKDRRSCAGGEADTA
jgi:integrase